MFRKVAAIALVCVLVVVCVPSLADETPVAVPSFTLAGLDETQYRAWNENKFFERMETLTGIHVTATQYADATKWKAAKQAMKLGADMPDALFKASLSSAEIIDMTARGALIDLKPLLAENCPNITAILDANPDYARAITMPDGTIPALPYIYSTPLLNCLWINQKWLETLKLSAPTDAQELVNVLEAFRDRDPNQNGKKDEIPLGFLGAFDLKYLAHAFGLHANDYNVYVDGGTVKYMPLDENFRLFVTWCRDLYVAGLLDNDGFATADTLRTVTNKDAKPTYGAIFTTFPTNLFQTSWASDYVPLMPLMYNGKQVYRQTVGKLLRGAFAVTSACEDPTIALKWVDALYDTAGARLAYIGLENTDYLIDGDGTWRYTEAVSSDSSYSIVSLISGGAAVPGVSIDAFQKLYSDQYAARTTESLEAISALTVESFPYYNLTRAQSEEIASLQNPLGMCVDMHIARWVLGEIEISDATFQAFEEELNTLGLDAFLRFWQGVYDNLR